MEHKSLRFQLLQSMGLVLVFSLALVVSQPVLSAAQVGDNDQPSVQQGPSDPQPPSPYVSDTVRQGDDAAPALPPGKGEVVVPLDRRLPLQSPEGRWAYGDRGISPLDLGEGSAVDAGYNWLVANQNPSGSWGSATELRDTMAVMEVIRWLGETDETAYQAAINWFRNVNPSNNDYLARKIAALANASEDVDALDDPLAAQRNTDSGFGYQDGYGSEVLTSLLVLKALAASEYTDTGDNPNATTAGILNYLLSAQNPDGGWGYLIGEPSNVYVTCVVLDAIWPYAPYTTGAGYVVEDEINEGLTWLKGQQNPDGGWGADGSTVYQTALAAYTLLEYEETPNSSSGAYNYLLGAQDANGSWDDDPYATALAIRALASFSGGLRIDNTFLGGAYTFWRSGYIAGTVLSPDASLYPVKVEEVVFWLYEFTGATRQIDIRVKVFSVRNGVPYALLATSPTYTINVGAFSIPRIAVDISDDDIIIFEPQTFMAAVEYVTASAGTAPSLLTDSSTNILPNKNWYSPNGGATWYEHYAWWADPANEGYNIIRATIKTNVATPQAITEVTATKSGNDVVLSWPAVTRDIKGGRVGVKRYWVYRSPNPLSEPISPEALAYGTTTSFIDVGAMGGADNYYYLVTAEDTLQKESPASNKVGKFNINMLPGWNLTSPPLVEADTAIASVLSTISEGYDLVRAYDASDPQMPWRQLDMDAPAFVNDLTLMDERMGFWVHMTTPDTLTTVGSRPASTSMSLHQGWNLVGYPSTQSKPVAQALTSIEGKYTTVYTYDASDPADPWKKYEVGAADNDLTVMEPGWGYWIEVTEPCTLTIAND